jgi:hypothetical protein
MSFLLPLFSTFWYSVSLCKRIRGSQTYLFLTETPSSDFLVILTAEDGYVQKNAVFCGHENVELSVPHKHFTLAYWELTQFDISSMYILKNPSTLHSSLLQEIRVLSLHPLDI